MFKKRKKPKGADVAVCIEEVQKSIESAQTLRTLYENENRIVIRHGEGSYFGHYKFSRDELLDIWHNLKEFGCDQRLDGKVNARTYQLAIEYVIPYKECLHYSHKKKWGITDKEFEIWWLNNCLNAVHFFSN